MRLPIERVNVSILGDILPISQNLSPDILTFGRYTLQPAGPHTPKQLHTCPHTRSMAFPTPNKPQLVHRFRLWDSCVKDVKTGHTVFDLTQIPTARSGILSFPSKPLLAVVVPGSEVPVGLIRIGNFHMSAIDITIHDRQNKVSPSTWGYPRDWMFTPTSITASEPWRWQRDKTRKGRGVILVDKKINGRVKARISGDVLTLIDLELSGETAREVVMTAIALAEHVRRQRKHRLVLDVGGAIYNGSDGTVGGDGGGGCGGDGGSGGDGGGGGGGDGGGCS
jgi:uncharacterized membrane protein YgcG